MLAKLSITNKDEIEKKAGRKFKVTILTTIITCIVLLAIYMIFAIIYIKDIKAILIGTSALIGFMLLPVIVIVVIMMYNNYIKNLKKMPREIYVTDDEFFVDNIAYRYEDIKQIRATPPSYERASFGKNMIHRMFTIIDKNDKKTVFFMGFRDFEGMTFQDYDELCALLRKQFKSNPEKFIYEL